MQKAYLCDYSITDFEATVVEVRRDLISLNKTYFYPGGGHQINDTGYIIFNDVSKKVTRVFEETGIIYHEVDSTQDINVGDKVKGRVDKLRRKYLSTLHTAQHVISRIVFDNYRINTVTSEFNVGGSSIVFSSPLQPEWIEAIIRNFDSIVKREHEIKNKIVGDAIIVNIGDFDVEDCCGTHLINTSELDNVFIIGLGRKNHVLLFDAYSDYGKLKESLRDYYKTLYMLGLKKDAYSTISTVIDQHNQLIDEIYENCKKIINAKLSDENALFAFNRYKASFVSLSGQDIIAKIFGKVVKNADCEYGNIDFSVIGINDQYLLESFSKEINAKLIADGLQDKGIIISKGGGNFKKVNIVTESGNGNVFEMIKKIMQEVFV